MRVLDQIEVTASEYVMAVIQEVKILVYEARVVKKDREVWFISRYSGPDRLLVKVLDTGIQSKRFPSRIKE